MGLKFQTITVPSADPETTCLRLGLKATRQIESLCPLNDLLRAGSPAGSLPCYYTFELFCILFLFNLYLNLVQFFEF